MSTPRGTPGAARIGISGWRYAHWRGDFYPEGLVQREELAFASRMLPTIEINGTHYSLQRPDSFQAWHDATPEGFVFAVKGPRYVTHMRRLREVRAPLANFLASGLFALGAKLGPFLWQLPPSLAYDPELCEAFFALLPRDTDEAMALAREHDSHLHGRALLRAAHAQRLRHAVEVRHASYADAGFVRQLRRHRIALVVADTAGRWPLLEDVTADFMYLRLHGDRQLYASGYSDAALDRWAQRIDAWRRGRQVDDARTTGAHAAPRRARREVFCYFDNDIKDYAPFDAARLALRLGLTTGLGGRLRPRRRPRA